MQNQIPKDWQSTYLGDIVKVNMGQSPSSKFYNNKGEGLPFYQGVTDFGEKYPTPNLYCSQPVKIAEPGTVLFSVRAPVGDVNIVTEKSCIGRGVASLNMNNGNNGFLYFLLKDQARYLKAISGGTTYESINKDQIEKTEIVLPKDEKEQKQIASVLTDFDDKIEINNKIAKTLEEMSQVIFKEWFVKFRFPGYEKKELVDSELGKIPKGWKVGNLGELMEIKHGFAFPSEKFKPEGDIPVIKIKNIQEDKSVDLKDVDFVILDDSTISLDNFKLSNGDILIALTGATSGKIGILIGPYDYYFLNQRVGKFAFHKNYYSWFSYIFLTRPSYRNLLLTSSDGSAQGNLSPGQIKSINLVIPNDEVLEKFNNLVENFYRKIIKNKSENQKLVILRNLLLPKLMRGEIYIS